MRDDETLAIFRNVGVSGLLSSYVSIHSIRFCRQLAGGLGTVEKGLVRKWDPMMRCESHFELTRSR